MAELDHKLRAKGIGSSEIAMLVIGDDGKPLSRWGGPHKLWRIKTGVEIPDDSDKPWLSRGHALEPWILSRYEALTEAKLRRSPGTVRHKKFPYVVDSVDALAWMPGDGKKPSRCVEAKAPLRFSDVHYGEEGTDQVDRQYLVQGQWHMGAWDLPQCDYPIDTGTGDIKIYTSTHDEEFWMCLVEIAEKFWKDHVEKNVPPQVDASEATSQWLARRLEQADKDIIEADEEAVKKMLDLRQAKMALEAAEERYGVLANELKIIIGEHGGICLPDNPRAKITFTEQNGRKSFDQDAYIEELVKRFAPEGAELPNRKDFFKQGKPFRVFRTTGVLKHGE